MPDSAATPLRIVLLDDHEMVLRRLDAMVGLFPKDVLIIGQATTATALRLVDELQPNVALCDVRIASDRVLFRGQKPMSDVIDVKLTNGWARFW